ncbi:MAG: dTDP-4-dehydrorhamnose reductase [Prevotella sp.]|nr:dTDP-4-dehydrorhamnose reductase [Prevotella sp.]
MNILVTGANGQLGHCMQNASTLSADRYIFTDVCEGYAALDITDPAAVRDMVKKNDVRCIINCAAWTDVDRAETAGEIPERLNAAAPGNLATVMKEVGGLIVHISTDYVFGFEPYNKPCKENQQGTPTGVYGQTKLHGEQRIMQSGADYVIIRTAWLYSEYGKNFVKTMLSLTSTKPQIKVVFDQCGTPTYAQDLADAIVHIVETRGYEGKTGIYHYSNEGVCSWYDFAVQTAKTAGNTGCEILPCHSDEFPSIVRRPAYSVLDKTKIKDTFSLRIPYWTDSLARCIANIKREAL